MRTVLFRVTLAFSLLLPSFCPAQLLLYKGLLKMNHLGDGGQSKQSYRAWILLDQATGNMAKINYFSAARLKLYTVEEYPGLQRSTALGSRGSTNSLLTLAQTSLDESNRLSVTTLFLQGANKRLTYQRGSTLYFPGILSWSSRGVAPSTHSPLSVTWSETGTVAYNTSETTASNNHGETLAQTEARLIAQLQNQGYREALLP